MNQFTESGEFKNRIPCKKSAEAVDFLHGEERSLPVYKQLWKECFADTDSYIDAFFEAFYEKENVLAAVENGMLLGASFFLPGKIYRKQAQGKEEWQEIRYVYALAVFPKFRGRGIAGSLLRRAYERYRMPLIAQPAEEGLVGGFYRPLGFAPAFYLQKTQITLPSVMPRGKMRNPDAAQIQIRPADAADYCRIRDAHFKTDGYVSWPVRHIAFALWEHRRWGGEALVLARDGREDILMYEMSDGAAVITETTLSREEVLQNAADLFKEGCLELTLTGAAAENGQIQNLKAEQNAAGIQQVRAERAVLRMPESLAAQTGGKNCLVGMSYGMRPVYGYLNLSLD